MRTSKSPAKPARKAAPVSLSKLSRKAKAPVKVAGPKAAPVAKTAPATADGKKVSVLKSICAEVGIAPKTARRVLRAIRRAKEGMQWHSLKTRWILTPAQRSEVRKHLAAYVERNGESEAK